VYLIHRRQEFRASKILQKHVFDNPKIQVIWDTVAEKVEGDPQTGMTGLRIRNLVMHERKLLDATGLFVFIGFRPNTGVIAGHFDHDVMGYVLTDNAMMTSIPGLFVAGDLRAQLTRQVTTASGDATTAAIAADKYITRFREMERDGANTAEREAVQSSHVNAGGYT
jgi:thioredoxin reductase (NADPH)